MELFQLRSFLYVAEEGSITRAADLMYLTQPAVTRHIKALEEELGVILFDRTGRGVQLTEAGKMLRDYAKRSMSILDECRQVIADLQSGKTGMLSLGAGGSHSIFNLPERLYDFQEAYPGVEVIVRTGRSREIVSLVIDREVDLGLVTSAVAHPELKVIRLYEEEIVLVAPSDSSYAGKTLELGELSSIPLVLLPRGTDFREYLVRSFEDANIAVAHARMEADSVEAIKSFMAARLGVSFLPVSAVEEEIKSGLFVKVEVNSLPVLKRETSLIYRIDRYLSAAAHGFVDILTQHYCSGV